MSHGHTILRICLKKSFVEAYEKVTKTVTDQVSCEPNAVMNIMKASYVRILA